MLSIIQRVAARYMRAYEGPSSFMSWATAQDQLAAHFTGEAGQRLYEYIDMLHRRIVRQSRFQGIPGFISWDYGNVGQNGSAWQIRVWQKDGGQYPSDEVEPNLLVSIEFNGTKVEATLLMGNRTKIFSKSYATGDISASGLGMSMGEAWEKLLTGSVDYGD